MRAQWLLGKALDFGMRWFPKPKSAVERLAAMQLREREIEGKYTRLYVYVV